MSLHEIKKRDAQAQFSDLLAAAGVPSGLSWHSCRHTAIKLMLQQGYTTTEVMQMVGIRSVQTMTHYAHFESARLSEKYKNVDFKLGGGKMEGIGRE